MRNLFLTMLVLGCCNLQMQVNAQEAPRTFPPAIRYSYNGPAGYFKPGKSLRPELSQVAANAVQTKYLFVRPKPVLSALTENHLLYLNAGSFDFGGTSNAGYVGHFNVLINHHEKLACGFNGGFFKINYQNDSENPIHSQIDTVMINPLHPPQVGEKYLVQLNRYTRRVKNASFSIYAQPFLIVNSGGSVAFHAHVELYVNKYTVTTGVEQIAQDSLDVTPTLPRVIRGGLPGDSVYRSSYANGYFGVGATFMIQVSDEGYLFLQPTIGITTDNPTRHFAYRAPGASNPSEIGSFYLFRGYYQHRLGDQTSVLIGTDIRGLLPSYEPEYGVYAGINVGLEGVTALFRSK